jgi:hypothetical protein
MRKLILGALLLLSMVSCNKNDSVKTIKLQVSNTNGGSSYPVIKYYNTNGVYTTSNSTTVVADINKPLSISCKTGFMMYWTSGGSSFNETKADYVLKIDN